MSQQRRSKLIRTAIAAYRAYRESAKRSCSGSLDPTARAMVAAMRIKLFAPLHAA